MKYQFIRRLLLFVVSIIILIPFNSCKKDIFPSSNTIRFSVDTVLFDTVFTTIGSTTEAFLFYNHSSKKLNVELIELMGGENSPFRINIDGISGIKHTNVMMLPKDSLFGFVEVTLDVNNEVLPMIVEDSIRFRVNGTDKFLKLAVWGQDAYFHYNDTNSGVWLNDKPHVIYGAAIVDSAETLTIPKNTHIYLHKNSMLFVYKGQLKIEGEKGEEVTFQGDRLEHFYDDVAGQYYGIYFHESMPSTINYMIQKNGSSGIHITGVPQNNAPNVFNVTITNSILTNNANYGFFLFDGGKIKAENCVISKNGAHALFVLRGGSYEMTHCNILGYGPSKNAAIGIRNYYDGVASNIPIGKIRNSVIYGGQQYEIAMDTVNPNHTPGLFNFDFQNCLIKYKDGSDDSMFGNGVEFNKDPKFTDITEGDFSPLDDSPLINNGNSSYTTLPLDILGNPRDAQPDLGAFEKQ